MRVNKLDEIVSRSIKKITVSDKRWMRGIEYNKDGDIIHLEVNRSYVKGQSEKYIEIHWPFRLMDRTIIIIYDKKDEVCSIRDIFIDREV